MSPLDRIKLTPLMNRTTGRREVVIGLVDGPVATHHGDLASESIREIAGRLGSTCRLADSNACLHGTFVAGILCARRGRLAPAICPGCTLLIRPIFDEAASRSDPVPRASPLELAAAIFDCIGAGARIVNLSLGPTRTHVKDDRDLEEALNFAGRRGVIVVAAAGNQGTLGSSTITRHPWAIPVAGCDDAGRLTGMSNVGGSIGRRGLASPGHDIVSLGPDGSTIALCGTSVAVPFVTGAIALLWSEFPSATAVQIKSAITQTTSKRRVSVAPPLLDAAAAYEMLRTTIGRPI